MHTENKEMLGLNRTLGQMDLKGIYMGHVIQQKQKIHSSQAHIKHSQG